MKSKTPMESLSLLTRLATEHPEEFAKAAQRVCAGRSDLIRGIRVLGQAADRAANRAEADLTRVWQSTPALEKIAQIRLRIRQSRMEAGNGALRQMLHNVRSYLFEQKGDRTLMRQLTRSTLSQSPEERRDRGIQG